MKPELGKILKSINYIKSIQYFTILGEVITENTFDFVEKKITPKDSVQLKAFWEFQSLLKIISFSEAQDEKQLKAILNSNLIDFNKIYCILAKGDNALINYLLTKTYGHHFVSHSGKRLVNNIILFLSFLATNQYQKLTCDVNSICFDASSLIYGLTYHLYILKKAFILGKIPEEVKFNPGESMQKVIIEKCNEDYYLNHLNSIFSRLEYVEKNIKGAQIETVKQKPLLEKIARRKIEITIMKQWLRLLSLVYQVLSTSESKGTFDLRSEAVLVLQDWKCFKTELPNTDNGNRFLLKRLTSAIDFFMQRIQRCSSTQNLFINHLYQDLLALNKPPVQNPDCSAYYTAGNDENDSPFLTAPTKPTVIYRSSVKLIDIYHSTMALTPSTDSPITANLETTQVLPSAGGMFASTQTISSMVADVQHQQLMKSLGRD